MPKKTPKYRVLQTIWSLQHQKYFFPGDVIEFDPKSEYQPDFNAALAAGLLEPYTEDLTNGTNSPDSPENNPGGNNA